MDEQSTPIYCLRSYSDTYARVTAEVVGPVRINSTSVQSDES